MEIQLGKRGSALFSPERLQQIIQETVVPELDESHSIVGVGSVTDEGVKAALVFRKKAKFGEWRLEAAFEHDWTGEDKVASRVIFKL